MNAPVATVGRQRLRAAREGEIQLRGTVSLYAKADSWRKVTDVVCPPHPHGHIVRDRRETVAASITMGVFANAGYTAMKDIAVYDGASAAPRHPGVETDVSRSAWPVSASAATGPMRRVETIDQQWCSAWRTAKREGWSVSPPRPRRCDDAGLTGCGRDAGGDEGTAHAAPLPPPIARFLARGRRGLSLVQTAMSPQATTVAPAEVVSQLLPREVRFKTTYTEAEVFRSLSTCSASFTHAQQIADDLFTIAEYPEFTREKRDMLRSGAIMVDQLTGMATNVFRMQSVCKVFGIIANLLEGKPMTPEDVIDVNLLSRSFMSLKRGRSPLYLQGTFIDKVAPGFLGQALRAVDHAKTVVTGAHGPLAANRGAASVSGSRSLAITPDIEGRPITSLELFYSEPGERTVMAPPVEGEARADEARLREAASPEGAAEAMPDGASAHPSDPEVAMMRRISGSMRPADVEWAQVQSVPVRRRLGQLQWEQVPAAAYAVGHIDARGRNEGEPFIEDGKAYLRLDGRAVAMRELFPDQWWIVDNHAYPSGGSRSAIRLPPLPLRRVGVGYADRFVVTTPTWEDVPDVHGMRVADDGYIRYRGRKYIEIDGARVEAAPRPIHGEEAISDFAKPLTDLLPAADAMQIIHLADGSQWIEGLYGYYRLHFDLNLHDFYVLESGTMAEGVEPRRALVDFDIDRQRWTALVGRRQSGYEDILAARYVRVEGSPSALDLRENDGLRRTGSSSSSGSSRPGSRESVRGSDGESPVQSSARKWWLPAWRRNANKAQTDARDPSTSAQDLHDGAASRRRVAKSTFPLHTSTKTGLEREFALFGHYAKHLKRFPFFSRTTRTNSPRIRVVLRQGLRKTFAYLEETSMVAVNRMEPAVRARLAPMVLSLRQRLVGLYPEAEQWYRLTLPQKQQQVSHMVQVAYREAASEMWPCLSGYCNEIADVVLSSLIHKKPVLADHLMQLALYDQRGAKSTHVMVIYADQPTTLDVFADRTSQDVHVQRDRATFREVDFYDWLIAHRETVLLIDAWATNKLVDLGDTTTRAMVNDELTPNLMEAGFELNGRPRFNVRALLPRRPPNVVRPRRDVEGVRALNSASATWEVLAEWAVTGALPDGASARALSADLLAVAGNACHDAARQALLRRLAAEIAPSTGNVTAPRGIDRRTLVMAGHAAWALLDTAQSATASVASRNTTHGPDPRPATRVAAAPHGLAGMTVTEAVQAATDAEPVTDAPEIDAAITNAATAHPAVIDVTATPEAFDQTRAGTTGAVGTLDSYAASVATGADHSAIQQSGSQTYVWMPNGKYYAVREIMPGRLFIVDPDESPFGNPSLPPIPLERDGAMWRVVGRRL